MRKNKNKALRRKHPFTLIEILISMGLMSILLIALFSTYSDITLLGKKSEEIRHETFLQRYMQSRLSDALMKSFQYQKDQKWFTFFSDEKSTSYSAGQSLVFTFDNGISACDALFSYRVLSRLYLNDDHQLCLATWPIPEKFSMFPVPMKKEILLERVRDLQFDFFYYSDEKGEGHPDSLKELVNAKEPSNGHHSSWVQEYQRLPIALTVILTMQNESEIQLGFPLPNARETIIYRD